LISASSRDKKYSSKRIFGVVQNVTFLGNTDNMNFGWLAYDSTDSHPKMNHTAYRAAQVD